MKTLQREFIEKASVWQEGYWTARRFVEESIYFTEKKAKKIS